MSHYFIHRIRGNIGHSCKKYRYIFQLQSFDLLLIGGELVFKTGVTGILKRPAQTFLQESHHFSGIGSLQNLFYLFLHAFLSAGVRTGLTSSGAEDKISLPWKLVSPGRGDAEALFPVGVATLIRQPAPETQQRDYTR